MPSDAVHKYGAAFSTAWLNVTVTNESSLALELVTLDKTPTMVGESSMLTFSPAAPLKSAKAWAMDKIGTSVDPEDVIDGFVGRDLLKHVVVAPFDSIACCLLSAVCMSVFAEGTNSTTACGTAASQRPQKPATLSKL